MNKWTLHVEGFGKIKKADIQVSPLTLFIGDNNSGKSYIMILIYGLLNMVFYSDFQIDTSTELYQRYCTWIEEFQDSCSIEGLERLKRISKDDIGMFQDLLNHIITVNKERFIRELFNRPIDLKEIKVTLDKDCIHEFIGTKVHTERFVLFSVNENRKRLRGFWIKPSEESKDEAYKHMLLYILKQMLNKGFMEEPDDKTVYFPTARTGFLLTYKTLVGNVIQNQFNYKEGEKNLLTRPVGNFLSQLSSLSIEGENHKYKEITEFIECNLLCGKIQVSDLPSPDIMYQPEGGQYALPMFVTSAVVTEMAPLVLFLRYGNLGAVLIEEPEISLHPQLQWQMARVMIQLVNAGMPVCVSTHSDIILQHINNMIKANDLNDGRGFLEKENYGHNDLLDRKDVAVYQFETNKESQTEITRLPCGDYGFEAMTFYNTLDKMNQEIERLEYRMENV